MVNTNCRMYENQYPEVDDMVIVNVKQIAEMGAYVELLEYNNVEGMVLLSELSRRRIRSIQKLIRVNKLEVVLVLRVDKEKGYIDLSKRRVAPEQIAKCEDKYNKAKAVHGIMRHVSEKLQIELEELYTKFGWPLYKNDPESIFEGLDVESHVKDELINKIQHKMTPQPTKFRAGIDAIKNALTKGEEYNKDIKPKAVTQTDDLELAALMSKVAKENTEVSADESEDEQ